MKNQSAKIAAKILVAAKDFVYKRGFRPKRGSLLYSSSLEALYTLKKFLKHKRK